MTERYSSLPMLSMAEAEIPIPHELQSSYIRALELMRDGDFCLCHR